MKTYWKPLAVLAVTLGLVATGGAVQEATAPSTPDPPVEVDVDLDIDPDIVDIGGEVVQIGRSYSLPAGKRVESVVILAGTARIAGEVEQNLVVVGGTAALAGTARVGGDVVVVAGSGEVQPGTVVEGDLVAVGSGLKVPPGSPREEIWSRLERFPWRTRSRTLLPGSLEDCSGDAPLCPNSPGCGPAWPSSCSCAYWSIWYWRDRCEPVYIRSARSH